MADTPFDQVDLVKRAQAGEQQAFASLFERYHERILNYTYRTLGDRRSAEDVTQEAFIQAYDKLHQLGPPHDFKSWVYRIAGNMALYRLRGERPDLESDLDEQENGGSGSASRPPERRVLEEELGEAVQASLDRIPPDYRQALLLRDHHQIPYREMANLLERSYDSVRQLVHRARTRFMDVHVGRMIVLEGPSRCDTLGDLLSGYHDKELTESERAIVDDHILDCRACQGTQGRLRQAGTLMAALPRITAHRSWKEAALERAFEAERAPSSGLRSLARLASSGWQWGLLLGAVLLAVLMATATGAAWLTSRRGEMAATDRDPKSLAPPATAAPRTTSASPAPRPPSTSTPTSSQFNLPPRVILEEDARCRIGPGALYATIGYINLGVSVPVLGRDQRGEWWLADRGPGFDPCWVWDGIVIVEGETDNLPELTPPPLPTLTPTPSALPSPTATESPPAAPSSFAITFRTCTLTTYHLNLGWQDNSDNEDGFRIYQDGSLLSTLGPNSNSLRVVPPRGGGHLYVLEAFNGSGSSGSVQVSEKGCG